MRRRRCSRAKRDLVILRQVPLPVALRPLRGVQAEEVAEPSHRVHFAVLNDRRRNGADLLLRVEGPVLVGDLVGVGPERLPVASSKQRTRSLALGLTTTESAR